MHDPTSPLSRPSPKKKVRQFGADWLTRLTQTMKGFQVPHNGMASRDILDRELIANGSNNNIRNPVLKMALGDSTRALKNDKNNANNQQPIWKQCGRQSVMM